MSGCGKGTASNLFIDLATFSEPEAFIYGGPDAITWFVCSVQKSNWFSFLPISLRQLSAFNFGQNDAAASVNRSADYVMGVWFRVQIPQIQLVQATSGAGIYQDATIRWTRNLMHNLVRKVTITFNELEIQCFDSSWLDMNYQFRLPSCKRVGYRNMIGDIASMTTPVGVGVPLGTGGFFSLPLPFWFADGESGLALPVAALPFNDIKINYDFRDWTDLIIVCGGTSAVGGLTGPGTGTAATTQNVYVSGQNNVVPSFINPQTFAHYVVVHNDERVKMGDAPRDMLIKQIQRIQGHGIPASNINATHSFDVRVSHPIIAWFTAARNNTIENLNINAGAEWSNYTTEIYYGGLDPISYTEMLYENNVRVGMGSDYFSLIHPFYHSCCIPDEPGYHMYSFALKPWEHCKPSGSTNFSKLANVSINHTFSPAAQNASQGIDQNGNPILFPQNGEMVILPQSWENVCNFMNWNIVRVANGSLGIPVL